MNNKAKFFHKTALSSMIGLLFLEACSVTPTGPSIRLLPPPGKDFTLFIAEQETCKHYATSQIAGTADTANEKAIGTALIGTALGAVLGGAIGGGRGAGQGAAAGAVVGSAVGLGPNLSSQRMIQNNYDNAFAQCMASKGNIVPQQIYIQPGYRVPPSVIYTSPYLPPPIPNSPQEGYAPPPNAIPVPPNQ